MSALASAAPAFAMIAAFALVLGGILLLRDGRDRRKGVLMLIMAAVLGANVLVWTL